MVFYLLPWSRKQSSMDIVRRDLSKTWKEREGNRFEFLNPLRAKLIKEFGIKTSPLAPVWRRYKNKFWEELSFWALPTRVQQEIEDRGLVLSPLFGLLGAGDLIPKYELDWKTNYQGKTLKSFWSKELKDTLMKIFDEALVFDFLSSEDRSVISFPESTRRVVFEYYRKDKRVINTLPHRAYTLRYIVEMGVDLNNLGKINFLDYRVKDIQDGKDVVKVILQSEGKYI